MHLQSHTLSTLSSPNPINSGPGPKQEAPEKYTEKQQKFNYHHNLLIYMLHSAQHSRTAYDAQKPVVFNMFFGFSEDPALHLMFTIIGNLDPLSIAAQTLNVEKLYHRQEIFNNLLVFLIAILVVHQDIILCNAYVIILLFS